MNIIIYLIIFIICFLFLYLSNKLLGNLGLVITTITMNITSFILSFKYTTLSTINLNSNSICYVTMLISLYLLIEKTNKEETRKISNLNFIINIFIGNSGFSILISIISIVIFLGLTAWDMQMLKAMYNYYSSDEQELNKGDVLIPPHTDSTETMNFTLVSIPLYLERKKYYFKRRAI